MCKLYRIYTGEQTIDHTLLTINYVISLIASRLRGSVTYCTSPLLIDQFMTGTMTQTKTMRMTWQESM